MPDLRPIPSNLAPPGTFTSEVADIALGVDAHVNQENRLWRIEYRDEFGGTVTRLLAGLHRRIREPEGFPQGLPVEASVGLAVARKFEGRSGCLGQRRIRRRLRPGKHRGGQRKQK